MLSLKDLDARQVEKIDMLIHRGWALDNLYGDGIVSLSRRYPVANDEKVMVFVTQDGTIKPPRTSGTMLATAELMDELKPPQRSLQESWGKYKLASNDPQELVQLMLDAAQMAFIPAELELGGPCDEAAKEGFLVALRSVLLFDERDAGEILNELLKEDR